jgi:hypothetical protein
MKYSAAPEYKGQPPEIDFSYTPYGSILSELPVTSIAVGINSDDVRSQKAGFRINKLYALMRCPLSKITVERHGPQV